MRRSMHAGKAAAGRDRAVSSRAQWRRASFSGRRCYRAAVCLCVSLLVLLSGTHVSAREREDPEQAKVGFLGIWDRAKPLVERASREAGVPVTILDAADVLATGGDEAVSRLRILFILNLANDQTRDVVRVLRRAKAANEELEIIPLDQRDSQAGFERAGLLRRDSKVPPYWRASGLVNMRRLLAHAAVTYLGERREVLPPAAIPDFGYYHPALPEPTTKLGDVQSRVAWAAEAPGVALLIQQSFWVTQDTAVVDAEIRALEREGFNAVAIFADTGARMAAMLKAIHPSLIVEDRHGSFWEEPSRKPLLEELAVPYLRPISMLAYTIEQWRADPRGLHTRDVGHFMSLQEMRGTVDPIVVGGLKEDVRGFKLHVPIPERIERFAQRAARWHALRKKPNSAKHIAIVYYNKSLGQDDLLRGSPTGAFLDGPRSLVRFLPRLRDRGFLIEALPRDEDELLRWVRDRGRNIGPWAQGELEAMADRPGQVLIPLEKLDRWLAQRLTPAQREALETNFGPSPGRLMVVSRNGRKHVVLPMIRLGNVVLAPQPERGEKQDERLLHSRDVPPPYNYLAFYWWLQEDFAADAVVHWGTHGTLELLPGKEAGLTADDWSDLLTGPMPIVNPWIMDNLGEATLSRRRSYCAIVDHLVPAAVNAGLTDELKTLHDDIDKFETLEQGLLREEFRKQITAGTRASRIDETLHIEGLASRAATDEEVDQVATYLHEVYNTTTPTTLHVLGEPPPENLLASYLVTILGAPFLDRLSGLSVAPQGESPGDRVKRLRAVGERIITQTVLGEARPPSEIAQSIGLARDMLSRLRQAGDEIENLIGALEGRYVPPGPGPDPVHNRASVPSGRNLYALNPEEIPTRPSWEVAKKLVDELLKKSRPQKVGVDLNGMNTMRDYGVMEGQVLYLMGARPIWNANGLVVDVELIPREELGRRRIDVFVAMGGQYKENFPSRVRLLDKAIRLVSSLAEEENGVRIGTVRLEQRLLRRGFSKERARAYAVARIFGTKPGNMSGTNILHLIPRSGVWESDDEVSSVYIDSMSYAFTGGAWGEKLEGLYEEAIQGTDTLIRVWASNMTSQLSNHHAYEYLGGLSMAVEKLTGHVPNAFIADVRDPGGVRMRGFEEVLATSLRAELLNRKWIEGMKGHAYAGAGMMAELVKNTFGWDVTRTGSVSDGVWNDIYETYIEDRYRLGLREWFESVNPHALQEMSATMIEAARKGYWGASAEVLESLSRVYASSVVRDGPSGGIVSGGNTELDEFVQRHLDAPADVGLAEKYAGAMARSREAPSETRVRGPVLEVKEESVTPGSEPVDDVSIWLPPLVCMGIALLFLFGLRRRFGGPKP